MILEKLSIAFYHSTPLPAQTYGGTERIMFWHMKELVRLGHKVTLLGPIESHGVVEYGIEHIPLKKDQSDNDGWIHFVPKDVDIIHLQVNLKFDTKIPALCTIHGNGQIGEIFSKNAVFVSKSHARNHGSNSYINNAIDPVLFPKPDNLKTKGRNSLLFLAKVSWRIKNVKDSIKIAKATKMNLHIAGGRKLSFSSLIHNHGFINGEQKLKLMHQCDAMIFPVLWQEPFGMAMIESMSQGLPVFGSKYGSLPDVIGKAGKACQNYQELLDAIRNWDVELSPTQIRDYCFDNFLICDYTSKYIELYQSVISGKSLNTEAPQYQGDERAERLLSF